VLLAVQ
ncbi:oligopeptide transport system permease protein oppB, partial [Vibrio parahaemolyticus V-223/04]